MSNSCDKLILVTGDTVTQEYQLVSGTTGLPENITGMFFKFGVKLSPSAPAYLIGPIDGVITDAVNGRFKFTYLIPATPDNGVREIQMDDGAGTVTTLTRGGGLPTSIVKEIITP